MGLMGIFHIFVTDVTCEVKVEYSVTLKETKKLLYKEIKLNYGTFDPRNG